MIKSIFKPLKKVALTLVLLFLTTSTCVAFTLADVPQLCANTDELEKLQDAHTILIQQTNRINAINENSSTKTHITRCCIVLGIDFHDLSAAKKTYLKLCLKFHPDKNNNNSLQIGVCQSIFQTVSEAHTGIQTYLNHNNRLPSNFEFNQLAFMGAATYIHNFLITAGPSAHDAKPPARPRAHKRTTEPTKKPSPHHNASQPTRQPAPSKTPSRHASPRQSKPPVIPKTTPAPKPPSAQIPPARSVPAPAKPAPTTTPTPATQPARATSPMPKTPSRHTPRYHATTGPTQYHKPHTPYHVPQPATKPAPAHKPRTMPKTPSRHTARQHRTQAPSQEGPTSPQKHKLPARVRVPPLDLRKARTSPRFQMKRDRKGCWWLTLRGYKFMLVNNYGKFKYPALILKHGIKVAASIPDHRNKSQLIHFRINPEERIAVFYALLTAGISQYTLTQSLRPSAQTEYEINRAAQLILAL